ncbi:MAG: DciA family protein [Phycisphaerales bacterium]|jgi:hypothetical protein
MSGEIDRIRRLSGWRTRPERGAAVQGDVAGFARDLRKLERSIGAATDAWARLAPAELQTCATVETLRGGTLTLRVDGSAAAYEVDRTLRGGLEANLRMAVPGLMRVRTRVGGPIGS